MCIYILSMGGMITQTFERKCHHSVAHDTNWIMNFFIYFYPKNDLTCHHFRCFSIVSPPFLGPWRLNACFQRLVVVLQPVATEVVQSCRSLKSIRRCELQTFGNLDGRWLRKHRKLGPEIQKAHTPLLCLEGFESDRKYYYFEKRMWFGVKKERPLVIM